MSSTRDRPLYHDISLRIIFAVTLIAIMGVSSITPAFPKISGQLNVSPEQVGLLITVFTLPGVFLTAILGVFADRFGRKTILVPSLFLFGLAGAACAFAREFHLLLIFRLLQGIGGASLGSLNITIIGDLYSGHERSTAMGYNASVLSIGTASYPVIGGALAGLGWYFPFFLPLLAIPVGLLVIFQLQNPEPEAETYLRTYLRNAWHSIKQQQVIGIFLLFIATFIILYGPYLSYIPFLIEEKFRGSSFIIGLIFSIGSFSTAITSSQLGRLTQRFRPRPLLVIAFVLYLISMIAIPLIPSLFLVPLPVIIFGIAQGLNIPNLQTLLAGYAPLNQRAAVMSINGMVLRLGQTLGPVIMGVIFALSGIRATFFAGGAVALLMLIIGSSVIQDSN